MRTSWARKLLAPNSLSNKAALYHYRLRPTVKAYWTDGGGGGRCPDTILGCLLDQSTSLLHSLTQGRRATHVTSDQHLIHSKYTSSDRYHVSNQITVCTVTHMHWTIGLQYVSNSTCIDHSDYTMCVTHHAFTNQITVCGRTQLALTQSDHSMCVTIMHWPIRLQLLHGTCWICIYHVHYLGDDV